MSKIKGNSKARQHPGYPRFQQIDGRHPLRTAVAQAVVDYDVRTRHGGRVFYFNFELAKTLGLIPRNHPRRLNAALEQTLLETFSLQIINEYDHQHHTPIPRRDIRPQPRMATRYLQIQHPDKRGLTSGDGRSIWNGCLQGPDARWDIASVGTGVTRLSPATAQEGRFFKTGDKHASYGSGRSDLLDGVCTAVMSDILHRNAIPTERTLAIIAFKDGSSINVRAYKNLLRPAHFFRFVKQGDQESLRRMVDYYIARQMQNGSWPALRGRARRYRYLLQRVAMDFARSAARFEAEYIFCWMDWDGDNILSDGAIIDYGSLRQFGLYHHEYRYDDVDRLSTTITEQRYKARYIVQTFAQIVDFLLSGEKRSIQQLRRHPALQLFDQEFENARDEYLLLRLGLPPAITRQLLSKPAAQHEIRGFRKVFAYFEKAKSVKGRYAVSDGITWDAIFCMRDILRELPQWYLHHSPPMTAEHFIEILRSDYASDQDVRLHRYRIAKIQEFQAMYQNILATAASLAGTSPRALLKVVAQRSALINRFERITGDAIIHISNALIRAGKVVDSGDFYAMYEDFIEAQVLRPEYFSGRRQRRHRGTRAQQVYRRLLQVVREHREGI